MITERLIKNILSEELFGTKLCESIEDQEILDFFYEEFTPIFEKFLWGEPISIPELRKLLRKKIVNFEFIKIDGKVRPARGTTNLKYVPSEDHPKGIRPSSDNVATFFDLDKDAWRSVSKKSKEIVLKKDEEKNRPVIVVKDKDEEIRRHGRDPEKMGEEPPDELHVGDVRDYLNRNGKNVVIRITRLDDDGSVFAETAREKTPFKIPANRVKNIGELTELPEEPKPDIPKGNPNIAPSIIRGAPVATKEKPAPEMKPVTDQTPEGGGVIELKPKPIGSVGQAPEEIEDQEDAEELEQE